MKAVKVGKYQIDIILEDDKYIDIYTYYDFDDGSTLTLDNGKGWRLNELTRYDRESGIEYKVSAEPNRFELFGIFYDFEIKYIKNNIEYKRKLIIRGNYEKQYVTQDMIWSRMTVPLTEEIRKKYNIEENVVSLIKSEGKIHITVEGDQVKLSEQIRDFPFSLDSLCNDDDTIDDDDTIEKYISNLKNDFDSTNTLLQDFYDFSRSIYVFGHEDEEPRIVKIVGNHTAKYEFVKLENGKNKVLCKHPNKYERQWIPTFYINDSSSSV